MNSQSLKDAGFTGWAALLGEGMADGVPELPGIYAVTYADGKPSRWPPTSCGGWHKGRDPSVPAAQLEREWVEDTDIVYIGKSDRTLSQRLQELARFGQGEAVAHWGGRMIWQLPRTELLTVSWLASAAAARDEIKLLKTFMAEHGRLPFANLRL